ncbi:MAG TPA: TlyA family RNA methyltransferase [Desulfobacterales bacterium]|nr:TlyA family RNA methyltransferase [Desulfobacterales bacterium]
MTEKKIRLDLLLVEQGLASSRQRARAMIMAGNVLVNDKLLDKPGAMIIKDAGVIIKIKREDLPFVSRGGLKLEAALKELEADIEGFICLDVGASTGGFTDCLLQHGARRVFAVDVGYGQLAWKLRQDRRVVILERTNIRHIPLVAITEPVDLITIDVSFISLKKVVPSLLQFIKKNTMILALIKPQFEVGKGKVGKGGVVRDPAQHAEVISDLCAFFSEVGLLCEKIMPSPILGPKGNKEFFIFLKKTLNPN